jgi:hypothetical protein
MCGNVPTKQQHCLWLWIPEGSDLVLLTSGTLSIFRYSQVGHNVSGAGSASVFRCANHSHWTGSFCRILLSTLLLKTEAVHLLWSYVYNEKEHHLYLIWSRLMNLLLKERKNCSWKNTSTYVSLDDQGVGVRVPVGARIFTSPCRPDRLWVPPNLLSNG